MVCLAGVLGLVGGLVGCGSSGEGGGRAPATDLGVVISATTTEYPHADGRFGQTAVSVRAGVRSLTLIDETSGARWPVFEAAPGGHEVAYDDGGRTTLVRIAPEAVVAGHYTRARMVQDWSRFSIDATLHEGSTPTPGTLHALQVTSEGAVVDGVSRPQGWFEQEFSGKGVEKSYSGDDAVVPEESHTAEAEAIVEDGQWAVYFPLDLEIPEGATGTLNVRVNMHEAFRWDDLPGPGWSDAVYDIAPPLYEPVAQFGGNRFDVGLEP